MSRSLRNRHALPFPTMLIGATTLIGLCAVSEAQTPNIPKAQGSYKLRYSVTSYLASNPGRTEKGVFEIEEANGCLRCRYEGARRTPFEFIYDGKRSFMATLDGKKGFDAPDCQYGCTYLRVFFPFDFNSFKGLIPRESFKSPQPTSPAPGTTYAQLGPKQNLWVMNTSDKVYYGGFLAENGNGSSTLRVGIAAAPIASYEYSKFVSVGGVQVPGDIHMTKLVQHPDNSAGGKKLTSEPEAFFDFHLESSSSAVSLASEFRPEHLLKKGMMIAYSEENASTDFTYDPKEGTYEHQAQAALSKHKEPGARLPNNNG